MILIITCFVGLPSISTSSTCQTLFVRNKANHFFISPCSLFTILFNRWINWKYFICFTFYRVTLWWSNNRIGVGSPSSNCRIFQLTILSKSLILKDDTGRILLTCLLAFENCCMSVINNIFYFLFKCKVNIWNIFSCYKLKIYTRGGVRLRESIWIYIHIQCETRIWKIYNFFKYKT